MKTRASLYALLALAALSAPAGAQQAAPPLPEVATIRVSATGEARAAPDQAWIDLGMETAAPTARAAGEQNAAAMARVIAALQRAGAARTDIQTHDYSLSPDYQPRPGGNGPPVIRGYRAANVVTVRTDRTDAVGGLIDASLAAGANRADGIRFGIKNGEALQAQALRQALDRGRAQAQTIAAGLGVRLGRVLDASTAQAPRPYPGPVMMRSAMADAGSAPTPVEAGEQSVSATVSLVFAIEGQ
ncbi:MAG: hypothetical protein JWM27_3992 [Gemmatimonadetes bacterium]|nr:hypothetical protein [Gemmatimonadota bacterium]